MKKGQMRMSFGVLFSIFLIAVFLFFGVRVLWNFVAVNDCVEIADFYVDFQDEIDYARSSQSTTKPFEVDLDSSVKKICFFNQSAARTGTYSFPDSYIAGDNFFLIQEDGCDSINPIEIKGIDLVEMTSTSNPFCFDNGETRTVRKSIYSRYVVIE